MSMTSSVSTVTTEEPGLIGMDKFCGEIFYDRYETINTTSPELSQCFQHSVLVWIPCAFLWLFTPLLIYRSSRGKRQPLKWTPLLIARFVISALLCVITGYLSIDLIVRKAYHDVATVWPLYPILLFLTMLNTIGLFKLCQCRGVITSGTLFIFWLLAVICAIPELIYWIQRFTHEPQTEVKVSFFIYFILWLIQLFLSCFADKPIQYSDVDDTNPCPELKTSFLNQLTFWWFTRLAITGHKRPLESTDLWSLNKRDASSHLVPVFEAKWGKAVAAYNKKRALVLEERARTDSNVTTAEEEVQIVTGRQKPKKLPKMPSPPSLIWNLFLCFKGKLIVASVLKILFDLMQFIPPKILKWILGFIQDRDAPLWHGIFLAMFLFSLAIIQSMILHQYFHRMFCAGMNIKTVLTAAVFNKSLKLSNSARKDKTVGEIVNLMSVDVQRFQDITSYGMMFLSAPLQIILAMYFLWGILGPAVLGGLGVMILMIPINFVISIRMRKYQDDRIKMMNEILNGMKVLKLYAWEPSMEKMVSDIRAKEINVLKKIAYLNAFMSLTWTCAPFLVALVSFAAYVLSSPDHVLTPAVTFVALALFNILRFPMSMLASLIGQTVQVVVSNKRLKEFLASDELDPTVVQRMEKGAEGGTSISIKDGTFTWDKMAPPGVEPNLRDINLDIPDGSLIAVVGQVGCGKSSLLSAMLGEMDKVTGSVSINGSVSYVPQQAWIQNLSLKQNVTFGRKLSESRYQRVVDSCALVKDFETLPAGDATEIGEKGINLSGGQKQRVSLARAVYQDRDIYLLDDPLSAVDSHVGKHIFDNVIGPNGVLKNKTRILVTHGLTYLKHVDMIVVVKGGRISEAGSYEQLMLSGGAFAEFLEFHLLAEARQMSETLEESDLDVAEHQAEVEKILEELAKYDPQARARLQTQISQISHSGQHEEGEFMTARVDGLSASSEYFTAPNTPNVPRERRASSASSTASLRSRKSTSSRHMSSGTDTKSPKSRKEKEAEKEKLIQTETTETGRVQMRVYLMYIQAIGYGLSVLFFIVYIFSSALGVMSNLWLAQWSDDEQKKLNNETVDFGTGTRLGVYGVLGIGQALMVMVSAIIMALGMVLASKRLHFALLHNIMRSPMAFFDVTPLGRILNRFSKDIDSADNILPNTAYSLNRVFFTVLEAMVVILLSLPIFGTAVMPMGIIYFFVMDVEAIDATLPFNVRAFMMCMTMSLASFFIVLYATPVFVVVLVPLMMVYFLVLDVNVMDEVLYDVLWDLIDELAAVIQIIIVCSVATPAFMIGVVPMFLAYALLLDTDTVDNDMEFKWKHITRCFVQIFETSLIIVYTTPTFASVLIPIGFVYFIFLDVDALDTVLPDVMRSLMLTVFATLMILTVVAIGTPIFLSVVLPLGALYVYVLRFYVSTSRQLKRLESVSRSPIYSHFQEAVQGATSIRAYNVTDRFMTDSETRVDTNLMSYYPSICANRWLAVRLEFVGNCVVLFAALFAVLFKDSSGLTAGLAGLSITYALNADWDSTTGEKPPQDWPDQGVVLFDGYATRYRPGLDLVLRGVTAQVAPSEKIGIVGRTGAGKSSLTLALFRIIESAEGKILIDGKDISKMGLHDLRQKLTIIPQEPVLFSGTLRMNLDPFGRHTDQQLWDALEHSHLKEFASTRPQKLEYPISEGGENLSVGERQLLCLARALLRKTKVLILDEATAAVDLETDALIQKTIRTEFADCTILTIAHRLNTIMDSDRVMVLEQGKIKEFAPPQELLADQESEFYSMAKDAHVM